MRILYLYAHPLPDSFHAAILAEARAGLAEAGHEVDLCDLYAEGFNPVLSPEERRNYHNLAINHLPCAGYIARLRRAEALVVQFPTWSYGLPAILKGFFDRVFIPGVSFVLTPEGVAKPALTHIRKIAGISTYGRPRWNAVLVGDPPRKAITRYLRALTFWRARAEYHALYNMNQATRPRCEAFLRQVRARMAAF